MDKYQQYLEEFKQKFTKLGFPKLAGFIERRDGAAPLASELARTIKPKEIGKRPDLINIWELSGNFYRGLNRHHEALIIFHCLYDQLLIHQDLTDSFIAKGLPLVWISECHKALGHPVIAKRYLMLTACEDAIRDKGKIPPETTGAYFRLVWESGLSDGELKRYARGMWKLYQGNPKAGRFPEWILQHLDQEWITAYPSSQEATHYVISRRYVQYLMKEVGSSSPDGKPLEHLAHYLLGCMPGCRAYMRMKTKSTEYDVVCTQEGITLDFRDEMGRYFLAECKDWEKPANFTQIAKFCRVLDSAKCRFGILFSSKGVSGEGKAVYGERELLKVFHDRGIIVVVISIQDLQRVASGANFLTMLRTKYEKVRLDLAKRT